MPIALQVYLENTPGALARVAGIFSALGCNIDSLTVVPDAAHLGRSSMTIVATLTRRQLDLALRKINSLVSVISAEEIIGGVLSETFIPERREMDLRANESLDE